MSETDVREKARMEPHNHLPSEREREAMAILYEEGWTSRELAMVFEIQHKTVLRYVRDQGVET